MKLTVDERFRQSIFKFIYHQKKNPYRRFLFIVSKVAIVEKERCIISAGEIFLQNAE